MGFLEKLESQIKRDAEAAAAHARDTSLPVFRRTRRQTEPSGYLAAREWSSDDVSEGLTQQNSSDGHHHHHNSHHLVRHQHPYIPRRVSVSSGQLKAYYMPPPATSNSGTTSPAGLSPASSTVSSYLMTSPIAELGPTTWRAPAPASPASRAPAPASPNQATGKVWQWGAVMPTRHTSAVTAVAGADPACHTPPQPARVAPSLSSDRRPSTLPFVSESGSDDADAPHGGDTAAGTAHTAVAKCVLSDHEPHATGNGPDSPHSFQHVWSPQTSGDGGVPAPVTPPPGSAWPDCSPPAAATFKHADAITNLHHRRPSHQATFPSVGVAKLRGPPCDELPMLRPARRTASAGPLLFSSTTAPPLLQQHDSLWTPHHTTTTSDATPVFSRSSGGPVAMLTYHASTSQHPHHPPASHHHPHLQPQQPQQQQLPRGLPACREGFPFVQLDAVEQGGAEHGSWGHSSGGGSLGGLATGSISHAGHSLHASSSPDVESEHAAEAIFTPFAPPSSPPPPPPPSYEAAVALPAVPETSAPAVRLVQIGAAAAVDPSSASVAAAAVKKRSTSILDIVSLAVDAHSTNAASTHPPTAAPVASAGAIDAAWTGSITTPVAGSTAAHCADTPGAALASAGAGSTVAQSAGSTAAASTSAQTGYLEVQHEAMWTSENLGGTSKGGVVLNTVAPSLADAGGTTEGGSALNDVGPSLADVRETPAGGMALTDVAPPLKEGTCEAGAALDEVAPSLAVLQLRAAGEGDKWQHRYAACCDLSMTMSWDDCGRAAVTDERSAHHPAIGDLSHSVGGTLPAGGTTGVSGTSAARAAAVAPASTHPGGDAVCDLRVSFASLPLHTLAALGASGSVDADGRDGNKVTPATASAASAGTDERGGSVDTLGTAPTAPVPVEAVEGDSMGAAADASLAHLLDSGHISGTPPFMHAAPAYAATAATAAAAATSPHTTWPIAKSAGIGDADGAPSPRWRELRASLGAPRAPPARTSSLPAAGRARRAHQSDRAGDEWHLVDFSAECWPPMPPVRSQPLSPSQRQQQQQQQLLQLQLQQQQQQAERVGRNQTSEDMGVIKTTAAAAAVHGSIAAGACFPIPPPPPLLVDNWTAAAVMSSCT